MNAPLRDNVLRAAAELKIDDLDDLDELDQLLDEIGMGFAKRNNYLHNGLCRHPTSGQVYLASIVARGSLDADLIPITAPEISADARFIYEAGMRLMVFLMNKKLLPPHPAIRRERMHKRKAARKKRRKDMLKGK